MKLASTRNIWILYFCYSAVIAIIFQKLLLPLIPSLHGGAGLISNDAHLFHLKAIAFANEIKTQGWTHWTPWISKAYTGNVATLAALYVYFKPDPAIIIPINAALHATGGILILLIGRLIWPGRTGLYAGLAASVLFIIFPSALNWYAQIHKDGYSIAGLLIFLYSWLSWSNKEISLKNTLFFFLGIITACLLIAYVRPHIIQILIPISLLMFFLLLFHWLFQQKINNHNIWSRVISSIVAIVLIMSISVFLKKIYSVDGSVAYFNKIITSYKEINKQNWQSNIIITNSNLGTTTEEVSLEIPKHSTSMLNAAITKQFIAIPETSYIFSVYTNSNSSLKASITLTDGENSVSSIIKKGKHSHKLILKTSKNANAITVNLLSGELEKKSKTTIINFTNFRYPYRQWQWEKTSWLPEYIENNLQGISTIRTSFIRTGKDANSIIDKNIIPSNAYEMVRHFPRALQIALLAPFPDTWLDKISITRLVGITETFIWYLIIPGIFMALFYRPSTPIFLLLIFSLSFLLINGYITTNIGSLHRVRYPFIFLLMIIGSSGWIKFIYPRYKIWNKKRKYKQNLNQKNNSSIQTTALNRKQATKAGVMVTVLTGGTFLLLFFRDILMSRWYGLGIELDAFYIAMAIPMFFVNFLSVPLGAAIIPIYQRVREQQGIKAAQKFISNISFVSLVLLGGLSLVLFIGSPWLFKIFGWGFNEQQLTLARQISPYSILLLFFSGSVILGNSILNANNRFFIPALANATVPIIAISFLFLLSNSVGIIAVAIGMVTGQIMNLFIIYHYNNQNKISFFPRYEKQEFQLVKSILPMLSALAISALFLNATVVIDSIMASTIREGSVGAYNLGIKAVSFITGVIGAGVTSVLLPYFSSYIAQDKLDAGRNELIFYLFLGSILTIPVGLIFFEYSYIFINFLYQGGNINTEDAQIISNVAAFGMIQLPFFTVNILLVRFANARQHSRLVLYSALVGIALNIALNFIFIDSMGEAGLALATTLALFTSSLILIISMSIRGDIAFNGIATLMMLWLLYLTAIVSLHFQSSAGVFISIISAIILLILGKNINNDKKSLFKTNNT